ncbi:MAG: Phenylalanyl-tRNA synthetase class IIc [Candidatus Parvarchaeum acidophilus ARMAN-5_'5-way FS']|jgi:phenylalanyl-tRNA synthetase alpha chain|uniref:phenylalanine--tRNA ligase n=1 Tax=Candidatus Parvarchaeum acidophilus ARMAN-5_'5-way FS' TaxID=994838 RepID=F2UU53_PARA5|nr:MAG: Phenylalanyl-tRNA synthetase class IIc [Candidatus Parvarchaeum acidophilus ARMAN-5_'5-way FS']
MEDKNIIRVLNKVDKSILLLLEGSDKFSDEIELSTALDRSSVINSGRKMLSLGLIKIEGIEEAQFILTKNGEVYLKEGLPEYRIFNFIKNNVTVTYSQLYNMGMDKNEITAAIGYLKKSGVLLEEKGKLSVDTKMESRLENRNKILYAVYKGLIKETEDLTDLLRRGIIENISKVREKFSITPLGNKIIKDSEFNEDLIDKLSKDNIKNWEGLKFREYADNPEILSSLSGKLNIKTKFSSFIKDVMISMGFKEMHSNYVESVFWNFDVMMFRQDHPDRDIQDTVYLNGGKANVPKDILTNVKNVYEKGFKESKYSESIGYRRKFDISNSGTLIMRGHTTATTFRYIHDIISKNKEKPAKFFSIDKSFRNETMDSTHLLELYQIEGIVYDDNLTVADLIGYIKQFYGKIGIEKIRLKPTYNPYTEPSLEIQAFSPKLNRWIELGNSGVFRPETLRPFGIKKNIVAWGFGMERMLNLKLGMGDIRDLYGAYTDIDLLRDTDSAKIFSEI